MKALIILFVLTTGSILSINAQEINSLDSLKTEIIKEITIIIQESNQEFDNTLKQLGESLKQQTDDLNKRFSNDAITDLTISVKSEAKEAASELIENKAEKLLVEVTKMINQSNKNLYNDITRLLAESKIEINQETEELINKSKESMIKRNSEIMDNNSSEIHLMINERMENENEDLQQKIKDQNEIITNLIKRIEHLENK